MFTQDIIIINCFKKEEKTLFVKMESCCADFVEKNRVDVDSHLKNSFSILEELRGICSSYLSGASYGKEVLSFESLEVFGSTGSTLCLAGACDIDMLISVKHELIDGGDPTLSAITDDLDVFVLRELSKHVGDHYCVNEFVEKTRVPILKLEHISTGIEVRISTSYLSFFYIFLFYLYICAFIG